MKDIYRELMRRSIQDAHDAIEDSGVERIQNVDLEGDPADALVVDPAHLEDVARRGALLLVGADLPDRVAPEPEVLQDFALALLGLVDVGMRDDLEAVACDVARLSVEILRRVILGSPGVIKR